MMSIGVFNKILKLIGEGKKVLSVEEAGQFVMEREYLLDGGSDMNKLIDLARSDKVLFYVYDESKEHYWEMEEIQ